MTTTYVTFSKDIQTQKHRHGVIPSTIEPTSEKVATSASAVQTSAAPAGTRFAVITNIDATNGVCVKVGDNPTAADGDEYLPKGVRSTIAVKENEKVSIIEV